MSPRPLIVADVGNSAIKVACYRSPSRESLLHVPELFRYEVIDVDQSDCLSQLPTEPCDWRVASVQRESEHQLARWVAQHRAADHYEVVRHPQFPLTINVEFPDRVGADRLATATAANALRDPSSNAIVIDAGTAITVDLIEHTGIFQGGVILPGRHAFSAALAASTDLLPLIRGHSDTIPQLPGKDTKSAIGAGSYWGTIGAVREVLRILTDAEGRPTDVFVTGGDGARIHAKLTWDATYIAHLSLMGIAWTTLETP